MKVILINGSPHPQGCTNRALEEIASVFEEQGVLHETIWLGKDALSGCCGCGSCRKTGKCYLDDIVNVAAEKIREADGVVFGSPVHYAGAGGTVTAFLDRLFYSSSAHFAGKPGCAVFSCRRGGASAAFDQLNKYFTISSMPIVSGQYWNMVHGNTPSEVEKDEEGLQIMRSLGRNMVWMMRCIEAGKEKGICFPKKESPKRTNFIR
ncbi:MAG: flavodoxin family protein [Clostridia bacterium]|nr:flavodoxin family protein [Clostridia bacterium]